MCWTYSSSKGKSSPMIRMRSFWNWFRSWTVSQQVTKAINRHQPEVTFPATDYHCRLAGTKLHCEAKNCTIFIFSVTLSNQVLFLIIFGAWIPEWICNKKWQNYPPLLMNVFTLPCETQRVNLFITTVTQTLNVMTNWQLQTTTSQQMFKMFAFGFETRIKTILPLINCLISKACLGDSRPC